LKASSGAENKVFTELAEKRLNIVPRRGEQSVSEVRTSS
jgi:hypothetical protein